ncbi:DUF3299 domain-containing protein [Pseudoalteromonas sp. MMG010]|uniref:DUF3299 domain-containing protein n=1 Tax=Pseudoalteromonas sp. MMG010 TaxID=2822685 RepID=UPI001B39EE42|nr:DUF3299 domain-containing protein [Pseudoalteromonas sp. MMG010]MBQ4833607.1 DUF3299 domain-containing protein [Pseudoalteromonas sp. MMG010]
MILNLTKRFVFLSIFFISTVASPSVIANEKDYKTIEWIQLLPKDDLDALLNPPEYLDDIADGSAQDTIENFDSSQFSNEHEKRYQQALNSMRVMTSFNNTKIRIPGFIVPLESVEGEDITEFFIVPYFGACLHLPPPPPNQIIYVEHKQGVELESLYDAFWFEGTLSIVTVENELGTSAYQLTLDSVSLYEEE